MEATLLGSHPQLLTTAHLKARGKGKHAECNCRLLCTLPRRTSVSLKENNSELKITHLCLSNRRFLLNRYRGLSEDGENGCMYVKSASAESPSYEQYLSAEGGVGEHSISHDISNFESLQRRPKSFRNRYLNLLKLGSVLNNAAESLFKSEIRRRLFVTAVLLVVSRVGYFIPLPGFDRRLIPENYLSFVSGSVDELGDFTPELKLSLFQLGLSPQIAASILMQVLCHVVPSLVKLRKEGLDGHEKIKSYIWWISLGFAILEALILACYALPYSIYAASQRVKHVMVTTSLLACGTMTTGWICDKITESGFGQGSSLIICAGILTGYTDTLYKMIAQLSGKAMSYWPYVLAVLGIFTVVTMWAVIITEGCRKIKLQYYGFKLASASREDSPIAEVEPYIPFNINPSGMQPLLTASYLLAFPGILARATCQRRSLIT